MRKPETLIDTQKLQQRTEGLKDFLKPEIEKIETVLEKKVSRAYRTTYVLGAPLMNRNRTEIKLRPSGFAKEWNKQHFDMVRWGCPLKKTLRVASISTLSWDWPVDP